jgi:tetratricopeptide (TPR) repeat protein
LFQKKDFHTALKYYNKSLELDPKNYEILIQRANTYRSLRKFSQAIIDYSEAIKINPGCSNSYYFRGLCRFLLDEHQLAIHDFKKAHEIDPQNQENLKMIDLCYLEAIFN